MADYYQIDPANTTIEKIVTQGDDKLASPASFSVIDPAIAAVISAGLTLAAQRYGEIVAANGGDLAGIPAPQYHINALLAATRDDMGYTLAPSLESEVNAWAAAQAS